MRLIQKAYEIAIGENGVQEFEGEANNPRIIKYHSSCDSKFTSDSIPWCSAFANWCIQSAGGKGTRSAIARSFLAWGNKISKPHVGCIVVFERGTDGISGHVGFFVKENANSVFVLGGNQDNMVCIRALSKRKLLGYRTSKD